MQWVRYFFHGSWIVMVSSSLFLSGLVMADDFKIKRAKWDSEKSRLVVRGEGRDEWQVTVTNAANGVVIGSDEVDDEEWRIVQKIPSSVPCRVRATQADGQSSERDVSKAPDDCDTGSPGGELPPPVSGGAYRLLAANDLGMHCADLDYQIFSILPPFNVVHAQVVMQGTGSSAGNLPKILSDVDVDLVYSAVSNDQDPQGPGSINTTSNPNEVYKTNFWDLAGSSQIGGNENTLGGLAYTPLYPSVLAGALLDPPTDLSGLCNTPEFPDGCPSILNLFEPLALETGLPVPDLHKLFPADPGTTPAVLAVGQQKMPGPGNIPQHFDRFDADLPFFVQFPFGYTVEGANWFAADGIPILPVDDNGNPNAYPLMRVQAIAKGADATNPENVLASLDVVLPVASEADCQGCHAASDDGVLTDLGFVGNGIATDMLESDVSFVVEYAADAPGDTDLNKLQNAAKINILRLHDAKHWDKYEAWDSNGVLVAATCNPAVPNDPNCLINQTPVQCSQCHYSPALDLAQAGPVDDPAQGPRGRQQLQHISQSRAMHGHHGQFTDLFPPMPGPNDPTRLDPATDHFAGASDPWQTVEDYVLEQTCYTCHPGKDTQCLRGAMYTGGMRCQDCHGDMEQVGNDFTKNFPDVAGDMDLSKRVSWADEPGCQSCHTGDASDNLTADFPAVVAPDGIRLLQAYVNTMHPDGSKVASVIESPASRFAENQDLYRLSQGHGGVKCEGCHGSTHAIWPNANPFANDNLAANQLQGHTGTVIECDTCHTGGFNIDDFKSAVEQTGEMGGPHGMHPLDAMWNDKHKEVSDLNKNSCRTCHGAGGEGTVLSRMAETRNLECKDEEPSGCGGDKRITLTKGTEVSCVLCHKETQL